MNETEIATLIALWTAIVCLFLFLLGRTGGERRLRSPELPLLLASVLVAGVLVWPVLVRNRLWIFGYEVGVFAAPAIQLAIGLIWIRVRKGYLIKPSVTTKPLAASPRDSARDIPPSSTLSGSRVSPLIFLSYRRGASSDVTGRIYDRLVQHFCQEGVFKDVDSIPLGVDFRKHLSDSVAQCQLLLAVIGKEWVGKREPETDIGLDNPRDFVRIEIESALQRRIPVIPVLVQGASLPQEGELPASLQVLAYHNAIFVRPDPDFHSDMARLIKGIEHHLSGGQQR